MTLPFSAPRSSIVTVQGDLNGYLTPLNGYGREPVPEACNGLDDDCDGEVDEGNPGGGAACGTDVGRREPGVLTCIDGHYECAGGTGPAEETCNGVDNDCDGTADPGCPVLSHAEALVEGSATHAVFPSLAGDGGTRVIVGFIRRTTDSEVFLAGWNDGTGAWSSPSPTRMDWDDPGITTPETTTSPRVAMAGSRAYLVWEELRGSARNIYLRRSTDGGSSWVAGERRVDSGQDTDSFSVGLAAFGSDVYVVWENMGADRSRRIYVASSSDVATSFGALVVWVDYRSGSGRSGDVYSRGLLLP